MQCRCASFTELIPHALIAEIFLPDGFAIHVESIKTLRFEICE